MTKNIRYAINIADLHNLKDNVFVQMAIIPLLDDVLIKVNEKGFDNYAALFKTEDDAGKPISTQRVACLWYFLPEKVRVYRSVNGGRWMKCSKQWLHKVADIA